MPGSLPSCWLHTCSEKTIQDNAALQFSPSAVRSRGSSNLFLIIVQYSAWSQCPICKSNLDNFVWATFVKKCMHVLRGSGWFVERVPENKKIKQILRQSWWSSSPWTPSSLLCLGNPSPELRGWGLPVGGMCAYFPAPRLKRNALCSNCWTIREGEVSRVSF